MEDGAILYVDPTTGTRFGTGAADDPIDSLVEALARIRYADAGTSYTVRVTAPTDARVLEAVQYFGAADITIEPAETDTPWFLDASAVPDAYAALWVWGAGRATLKHGRVYGGTFGVAIGKRASLVTQDYYNAGWGLLDAEDCYAEGTGSGWGSEWEWNEVNLTRCTGLGVANDGFNWHGDAGVVGVIMMTDCVGDNCGDEGVSPHNDVILSIVGGHFNGNVESGMAAVGNAVCNISGGAQFNDNGFPLGIYGGVAYFENTSGSIDGATMTGNAGPGVIVGVSTDVNLVAYTSTGNGKPDDLDNPN